MVDLDRLRNGIQAKDFFMKMLNADCERIAVENPVPTSIFCLPEYTQIIQPYYFGEPYRKRTCLWLKGLPKLKKENEVEPLVNWVSGGSKKADGTPRESKTENFRDAKTKSKTFLGIANAMANQ